MAKSVVTNSTVVTFHSQDVSPELFEKLKTSPAKRHVQGSTITVDLDKLSGATKFQLAREVSDLWVLTALIADDDPDICSAACVTAGTDCRREHRPLPPSPTCCCANLTLRWATGAMRGESGIPVTATI